jgi:hypothetical protein
MSTLPNRDVENGDQKDDANDKRKETMSREATQEPAENKTTSSWDCCPNDQLTFNPGSFGTYASYVLIICGMVASIIALKYAPNIRGSQWTDGCKEGFADSCKAIGAVLRFSFALSCIFALQLFVTAAYTKYFDVSKLAIIVAFLITIDSSVTSYYAQYYWVAKYLAFGGTVVGFFYLSNTGILNETRFVIRGYSLL